MTRRTFEVEWPGDLGPLWMNTSNLLTCLAEYCRTTRFRARDVTGDGASTTEWQTSGPREAPGSGGPTPFEESLRALLNRANQEAVSGTPDFILAEYLNRCLDSFHLAVVCREKWYGR